MAYKLKTVENDADVEAFLATVDHAGRVEDCREVMAMMAEATGLPAKMWGPSIIGFGTYHYVYDSGHEGDMFVVGLSPRKANLVCYIMPGFEVFPQLMDKLGKFKTGKSCLYLGRLSGVERDVLGQLIQGCLLEMKRRYPDCIATAADL